VSVGGGVQVVGDGSFDFGSKLQESSPGNQPESTAWTVAWRNGPDAIPSATSWSAWTSLTGTR